MVRPLKRTKKKGEPYCRPPEIEEAVASALLLQNQAAIESSKEDDPKSPKFIHPECVVHLVREARRRDDLQTMSSLLGILFLRCDKKLNGRFPDGSVANASEIRDDVLSQLGEYFALDGQEGEKLQLDFFEVRFNKAFRALCTWVSRKTIRRAGRMTPLPSSDGSGDGSDDAKLSHISDNFAVAPEGLSRARANEALGAMEDKDRRAFLLVHEFGAKIESKDSNEETAATIEGVSGREIRTRLARAREIFSKHTENI